MSPGQETTTNGDQESHQEESRRDGCEVSPSRELESGSEEDLDSSVTGSSLEVDSDEYSPDMSTFADSASQGLNDLEADADNDDSISMYAQSTYPRVLPEYQSEHPFDNEVDAATIDSARTLYAEDYDFIFEHGRRYCGDYYMPCDEDEQTRQWLIHSVYRDLFHSELTTVPLENPKYILDIGTGIGEWVCDMAVRYPHCQVFGTDIAPLQPTGQVPMNVEWNIEDAELDWCRPADRFDLVHVRNMSGAFSDWSFIYRQAFHCIRPGGSIEVVDFDDHRAFQNFLGFFPQGSPAHILTTALRDASIVARKPKGVGHLDHQLLIDEGFVDIEDSTYDLGVGHRESTVYGTKWLLALCLGMEATFLRSLTKYLGWDGEYVKRLCKAVEMDTRNLADDPARAKGFVVKVRVVVAKKPVVPGQWTAQALAENGEINDYSGDESTVGSQSCQTGQSEDTA